MRRASGWRPCTPEHSRAPPLGDRVVGIASRDKLATVAPFTIGPAQALTHLAVEPAVPADRVAPFVELGIELVAA